MKRTASLGFIFVTLLIDVPGFGLLVPILPKFVAALSHRGISAGAAGPVLADRPDAPAPRQAHGIAQAPCLLIDGTPVPLRHRRRFGRGHLLLPEAALGYCASKRGPSTGSTFWL